MRILITGVHGFVGSNLVKALKKENKIYGLDIVSPEKEGKFVLNEIKQTGNFGRADNRFKGMSKLQRMTKHGIHLLLHYPSEVIWTPILLMYHKAWKWNKVRGLVS